MTKVKEMKNENVKKVTMEEALSLGNAIISVLNGASTMPGKVAYALTKNNDKLSKYAKDFYKKREELLLSFVEIDEESGQPKMKEQKDIAPNGNPFVFKNEDDEQKYEKQMDDLINQPLKDFPTMHKVPKAVLENLQINPQLHKEFAIVIDELTM